MDGRTKVDIDTVVVTNTCNPDILGPNRCSDMSATSSKVGFQIYLISQKLKINDELIWNPFQSRTMATGHTWSKMFEVGVTYSAEIGLEIEGVGAKTSVTNHETQRTTVGHSYQNSQTVSASATCVAKPMTKQTCRYFAWKGQVTVGYTIHWKDGTTTQGTYRGEGWRRDVDASTQLL